jgi:diguanylate cyclase (GGDEF)-like protein
MTGVRSAGHARVPELRAPVRGRDAAATLRDALAAQRDRAAELRDLRAAADRRGGARGRALDAADRAAAARDRLAAAADRDQAAADRRAAAAELALESIDPVTGALGRRRGLAALERELERAAREREPLVLAFIDVDGLKAVNDTHGHLAGDGILHAVADAISRRLRSYDVIVRFGGDEFVCSLAGQDLGSVAARFDAVCAGLLESAGVTISVGVAARRPEDTLDMLIHRADAAMLALRRADGAGRESREPVA